MKDAEDEAFDDIARRQGAWGGGYQAKRKAAADKLQEPAKEPVSFPCCGYTDANAIRWNQFNGVVQCHMCGQVYTVAQPAQEPYDQTALELCNVCGWKTLIPDDCCLNCERAQPEPDVDYWIREATAARQAEMALRRELEAQPAQEPVGWADLQKKAQQIVESKFLWKRFIDGTPLANDIACWMADFARQYTPPPQRERVVFPTMLRKMWSGGEVQAWLDENVNKEKNNG